ncbi:alpha/beta hydrolase [Mariniluteicoccus endophyticus]
MKPPGFVDPPAGMGLQRYLGQTIDWGDCEPGQDRPEGTRCATIAAPLDHGDPDGQAITLALTRVPATRQPSRGSIFVNPGGPGAGGRELAWRFAHGGLEDYDIVGWDPRGTAGSTPVRCDDGPGLDAFLATDQTPDDEAERTTYLEVSRAFGASCQARSGRLLEHVSTVDTVRDLDLMRQLVGDEKLNYLGYSYGTDVGSRYAHMFPGRVGHVVLDSNINPDPDDRSIIQAQGFDRALEAYADWCVKESCGLGSDRNAVVGAVLGLIDGLDRFPIPVGKRLLTQSLGVTGVILPLYGTAESFPMLTRAVTAAREGKGEYLLSLADSYNNRNRDGSYDPMTGAFYAIRCLDRGDGGVAAEERETQQEAAAAPLMGPRFGADLVCPLWPVAPRPPEPMVRAEGAAQILVIGTTGDSATPYEYAERMARQLASGVLVTRVGEGHAAYGHGNSCIDGAVVDYFHDRVPANGLRCG